MSSTARPTSGSSRSGCTASGRARGTPALLGEFLELNVRLYSVDAAGRHGVVFLSLEASRLGAVLGARAGYALPYTWARMRESLVDDVRTWTSRRRLPADGAASRIALRVGANVVEPTPLDHFLTARWGLHHTLLGRTAWIPNEHSAWHLQEASVVDLDDGLCAAAGVVVTGEPDVRFSPGVRTTFGLPRSL